MTGRQAAISIRRSRNAAGAGDCEWIKCNDRIFQVVDDMEFWDAVLSSCCFCRRTECDQAE